jgi:hypothetical protein
VGVELAAQASDIDIDNIEFEILVIGFARELYASFFLQFEAAADGIVSVVRHAITD